MCCQFEKSVNNSKSANQSKKMKHYTAIKNIIQSFKMIANLDSSLVKSFFLAIVLNASFQEQDSPQA